MPLDNLSVVWCSENSWCVKSDQYYNFSDGNLVAYYDIMIDVLSSKSNYATGYPHGCILTICILTFVQMVVWFNTEGSVQSVLYMLFFFIGDSCRKVLVFVSSVDMVRLCTVHVMQSSL